MLFLLRLSSMNIRKVVSRLLTAGVLSAGISCSISSPASVVIAGTRVVYNAADSEVTLKLSNVGKHPALTQVWLDKGDAKEDPAKIDLPFMLTPALARIDPAKSQTVRISYTGEALPKNRESVLWFNLLEVPPKPEQAEAGTNYMQLAFRSRIKFFFRPTGLPGTADAAPDKLLWKLTTENGKSALKVSNPTPYHVTITEARVGTGDKAPRFDEGGMVTPGGELLLPLSGAALEDGKVSFTTLNDYGGAMQHEAHLH
ncbi:fimbria-related chaperone [Caballeronia fortuita]|uniref:Fimbria-related chaperone n=1 Tax=Caballeronia fortuita TaxID=1777138 RepID=A0A158BXK2_9BURK|nr:fimbria/pilus periplasmic chaperone [Caballeronia fortuita]SAK74834.1 fimbria-related chaperone [Caballeronia fortuita]